MTKKRAAAAKTPTRRVRDKWRAKQWYVIRAPTLFNEAPAGKTPADEPEKLVGRIAEITLKDVTGDFSRDHIKLWLRVRGIRGNDAVTTFIGHELASDYLRRFFRRRTSKLEHVRDVTTQDGFKVRLKAVVVTDRRCQNSQATAVRHAIEEGIDAYAQRPFPELVRDTLTGELAGAIARSAHKVVPVRRIEFRRSEVLAEPTEVPDFPDVFARPAEEAPPQGEAAPAQTTAEAPATETQPAPEAAPVEEEQTEG